MKSHLGCESIFLVEDFHLIFGEMFKLGEYSFILLTITCKLIMNLQNIWRRVVGIDMMYVSPSNIFIYFFLDERFCQICQATFGRCRQLLVSLIQAACGAQNLTRLLLWYFCNQSIFQIILEKEILRSSMHP